VPSGLRNVLDTALAYDPNQRFASAGEFSRALGDAVSLGKNAETAPRAAAEPAGQGWDLETLRKVEADLAIHIGPVAPFAVRRAARRADDLVALYQESAAYIENERERAEFLRSGLRFAATASDRTLLAQPGGLPSDHRGQPSLPPAPPDAAAVEAIEAELALHVGPIARILVKQQLQNFRSLPELYRNLADHISDDAQRAAFLNSRRI
jgi:eukaryotic-like serine/threonine-protein kinase